MNKKEIADVYRGGWPAAAAQSRFIVVFIIDK